MNSPGLLLLMLSLPAMAAETVALHPLITEGRDGVSAEELQVAYVAEVVKLDAELADSQLVREFLAKEPDTSCAGKELCLARMAKAAAATRAAFVTMAFAKDHF